MSVKLELVVIDLVGIVSCNEDGLWPSWGAGRSVQQVQPPASHVFVDAEHRQLDSSHLERRHEVADVATHHLHIARF